jgi:predicted AAA+ superfamily ATPase
VDNYLSFFEENAFLEREIKTSIKENYAIIFLMKKKIKQIIRDFHRQKPFKVKKRELQLPINTQKIITLMGVRRCGKTSILYDTINRLTQTIPKEQILFFNFEDERFELNQENLDVILQSYMELYPEIEMKNVYLFFDEIQNVEGWERFVRRVYDSVSQNIFITGSNSKLLSRDIATSLRGRTISYEVFPLSFAEYLAFQDIEVDLYSTKSLAMINNRLEKFLHEGAFPETVILDNRIREKILRDYYNVMIYKDLIERFSIKNIEALKFFLRRILASSTKLVSVNKIYNDLKSSGFKVGKNSLYGYLGYVEDIYLSLTLDKYSQKITTQTDKKVYSIDIGLNNTLLYKFSDDIGKSMENTVFLELRRREKEIYYHANNSSECDFVVVEKGKVIQAIQVTYEMSDNKTRTREVKGLVNACKYYNLDKGLIVAYDDEGIFEKDGVTIEIVSLVDFLLADKKF